MEGFTVKGANQFLQTSRMNSIGDSKSIAINNPSVPTSSGTEVEGGSSFVDTLKIAMGKVNEVQQEASKKAEELAAGKTDNIAEVMIATEKADIALKLMMQVRNKIIDAYQEIMKMQV